MRFTPNIIILSLMLSLLSVACSSRDTGKEGVGTSTQALTQEAAAAEVSRIEALVRARYDDYILTLSDPDRALEEAATASAGVSGYQLSAEWSHRGVVRTLWCPRMRIPVPAPVSATPREMAVLFLDGHGAIFGLSNAAGALQVERVRLMDTGGTLVRLKETLKGLPVFGAGLTLHVGLEGDIEWLAGLVLPESEVAAASVTPALTTAMAASAAGGTALGYELGWFDQEAFGVTMGPPRLSWRVRVLNGYAEEDVYIDAATGEELARVPLSDFNEHKEIFYCSNCYDEDLPGEIQFDDACHTSGEAQCPSGWCIADDCQNPSPSWEGTSQSIYSYTNDTYDYYFSRHGRDSWDNNQCGQPGHPCTNPDLHRMRASSDTAVDGHCPCNAQWRNFAATYGPAQAQFCPLMSWRDIVGHEFTHGVDQSEGDLAGDCTQSGAMQEAISDVFGQFIEHYATGSTDWAMMTGCEDDDGCSEECLSYIRYMNDPGIYYCGGCGEPTTEILQPDHWSNYRPLCGPHWNSTVISKAGHLLGREPGAGSETHWGVPVTGIGEIKAGKVWYHALVDSLSGSETFTTFRSAMLYNCTQYTTGDDYVNCFSSVRAVGLWSSDFEFGFETDATVDMARWTVSGQERRYVFYKGKSVNTMYYRYRTCPFNIWCSWSSATSFDSGSSGPSAAVLPGSYMVACFRNSGGTAISCDKWNPSGTKTFGPNITVSTVGEPSLVYYRVSGSDKLFITYRKSDNKIYWRKLDAGSMTWGSEYSTSYQSYLSPVLASSREDYCGPDDGYLLLVYARLSDSRIAFRKFDPVSNIFGSEYLAGNMDQSPTTLTMPGASIFRDRIHIAATGFGGNIFYFSCPLPCNYSTNWTRFVQQDPGVTGGLVLDNYGPYDGYLYLYHRLSSSYQVARRDKLSE